MQTKVFLECKSSTLRLLVSTKLEMLASLDRKLHLVLAHCALQSQHDLLCCLRLLVEDGLCLTTVTRLLSVVTALTLREEGGLAGLVLCYFVGRVLLARLALAVRSACLRDVDHGGGERVDGQDVQEAHAPQSNTIQDRQGLPLRAG